jgi:hypothetical protein
MEAKRARRDHITKLFEASRDDVRRAVEHAIEYFALPPGERSALQEARVIASDRELRAAVSLLINHAVAAGCEETAATARSAFESLIAELTGGNFQVAVGEVNKDHLLRLVHAGAYMRNALARLRDAELKSHAEQDPLIRAYHRSMHYISENHPFRSY